MQRIEAVRRCLKNAGHGSVNEVDQGDAKANKASETVDEVKDEFLLRGWEFNTNESVTIAVDADGRVPISSNWLKVGVSSDRPRLSARYDGEDAFFWDLRENDWYDKALSECKVVFDIADFHKLPEDFAQFVAWEAASRYYTETHQSDPPASVQARRQRAETLFLNTLNRRSIFEATGWDQIDLMGHVEVNIDGERVVI